MAERREHWQHHSYLLLFTMLWGANFILAEVALYEMTPIAFSVSRFVLGFAAMALLLYAQAYTRGHRLFSLIARKDWLRLLLVAVLGATLAPWLGIEGLARASGARASLWLALGPVMSVVFGVLMRTERIGRMGHLGIILTGMGTLVLALDGVQSENDYWLGDMFLFVALLAAVAELHIIKPLASRYGATPVVTARTGIGCVLYLLIASPVLIGESWMSLDLWTWVAILAGGTIGIGVGQWIKVRALETMGPTRVVLYGNLVPVAALLVAWMALGTRPSLFEGLAALFILLGAICLEMLDTYKHHTVASTEGAM